MTWNEMAELLALTTPYDQREPGEHDVKAWLLIARMQRWPSAAAIRVVLEHYSTGGDRPRITPAVVTDGIRAARREAAASFRVPDLPDALAPADYPAWYRAALAAHVDTVLDGWAGGAEMPRAAAEPAAGPLAVGAAPEALREQISRDLVRLGTIPRPRPPTVPTGSPRDPAHRAAARAELDAIRPPDPAAGTAETETEAAGK